MSIKLETAEAGFWLWVLPQYLPVHHPFGFKAQAANWNHDNIM